MLSSYSRCKSTSTFYLIYFISAFSESTLLNLRLSLKTYTNNPDSFPSLPPTPPPLRLPQAVQPLERVPLSFFRPSLRIWTNLVHQTYSSYFILFYQPNHRIPIALSPLPVATTSTTFFSHECITGLIVQHCPPRYL